MRVDAVNNRVICAVAACLLLLAASALATSALKPDVVTGTAAASGYIFPDYIPELPHGGYTATSNKCKICHALHGPDDGAFHLIRNARPEITFWGGCEQCHFQGSSFTVKYVYTFESFLGEHTIGAEVIPDSTNQLPEIAFQPGLAVQPDQEIRDLEGRNADHYVTYDVLRCMHCHSPHGNQVMGGGKILRQDPARNGGTAQTVTDFCADCHDRNALPNVAHPLYGDGIVDVGGGAGGAPGDRRVAYKELAGCQSCHAAKTVAEGGQWPHQSTGHKLLTDSYQDVLNVPEALKGDPYRSLPNMDQICLSCHINEDGSAGVGIDF